MRQTNEDGLAIGLFLGRLSRREGNIGVLLGMRELVLLRLVVPLCDVLQLHGLDVFEQLADLTLDIVGQRRLSL